MKKRIFSFLMALILVVGLVPATALTASAATMTTSESGIALIKGFEGFRANAYKDNGQWSIGYGTTSQEGATITEAEADAALREHVAVLEKKVNEFAAANSLALNQGQFDALISFSYNCGTGWLSQSGKFRSAVLTKAIGNDFLYAISLWGNVGGVPNKNIINRRLAEANLYLNGQYSTTPPSNFTYVILDGNGGSVGEDKMQGFDTGKAAAIKASATHTDSKLSFAGCYTAKSGGTKVTALTSANAGKTLYAMWGIQTKITNSYVNVRSGAGTYFAIVGKLNQGDVISVFETATYNGSLWGRYDGGWLALEYTDYNKPQQEQQPSTQPDSGSQGGEVVQPEEVIATAVVKCSTYVNVRNQPNTFGTVIVGKLANGTKVDIYEITTVNGHKWGRISTGWFCLDYAVLSNNTGSEPDPEPTPDPQPGTGSGSGTIDTVIRTGFVSNDYVNVRTICRLHHGE